MTTADQVRSLIAKHLGIDADSLTDDAVWCEKAAEARSVLVESPK